MRVTTLTWLGLFHSPLTRGLGMCVCRRAKPGGTRTSPLISANEHGRATPDPVQPPHPGRSGRLGKSPAPVPKALLQLHGGAAGAQGAELVLVGAAHQLVGLVEQAA